MTNANEAAPVCQTPPTATRLLKVVALMAIIVAALHLVWAVCDCSQCFTDIEVYSKWMPKIFVAGKSFSWSDLGYAFDVWAMDGDSRPRFLSYLCAAWTMKARIALWSILPPHPSFSPVWIFSLLVAPWLLYRFLRGALGCGWIALLGTGLYMVTAGYLSSATMMLHAGKPLANVVVIWTLYMAMRAEQQVEAGLAPLESPRFPKSMLAYLILVLPFLLFTDETTLFALVVIPVWNYRFFIPRRFDRPNLRTSLLNAACYCVPLLTFLLITFVAAPLLAASFVGRSFDFGSYLSRYEDAGKLDILHFLQHLTTLLTAASAPWSALQMGMPIARRPDYSITLLLSYLAGFSWLTHEVFVYRRYWKTYARTGVLVLLFLVFQTFVAAHHPLNLVVSGYYYGAIFSVLFAILLSCGLGTILQDAVKKRLAVVAICYLLLMQIYNFSLLNRSWMAHNCSKSMSWFSLFPYNPYLAYCNLSEVLRLYEKPNPGMYAEDIPAFFRRNRWASIAELWKRRELGYREHLRTRPLALADLGLLAELYYWRTPGTIEDDGAVTRAEDVSIRLWRAALARTHAGQPDEEPLPVLAFRTRLPGELDSDGFDTRFGYPWLSTDMRVTVQGFCGLGYTRWLAPTSDRTHDGGAFWAFHNRFVTAMRDQKLSQYGVVVDEKVDVDGHELAVMSARR